MIVVLMGVAGSGKSTVAAALRAQTGWEFAEGDDYHPEENRAKMAAGIALTDEDRKPWLEALQRVLTRWEQGGVNGILTCSALKKSYRERLREGLNGLRFVWLNPRQNALESRLAQRTGHYFNRSLLASQLETLEAPGGDEGVLELSGDETAEELARRILDALKRS